MTKDAKLKLKAWKKYKTECDVKVTGDLRDGFWAGWHYCRQASDAEIEELEAALRGCRKRITEQAKEILSAQQRIKELEEFQVHCPDCTNLVTVKELYDFDGMCEDCVLF